MNVRLLITALVTSIACQASAQGFAGLGVDATDFEQPNPDTRFEFPRDHAPHLGFRIEWWYLTANLQSEDGTQYGVQWTLFRNATSPTGRPSDQIWMGHAAVSSPDGHFSAERLARGQLGHAGVTTAPFQAFIDEWQMTGPNLNDIDVNAQGTDFSYSLSLTSILPFVAQGQSGYSVKSDNGRASHYYSQPFYEAVGTLSLPSGDVQVTGQAWLDQEWSSSPLTDSQTGWDWVSIHLDDVTKIMGFQVHSTSSSSYSTGTWISPTGSATPLNPGEITFTPLESEVVSGRDIPINWRIEIPNQSLDVEITAIYPDSWMDTTIAYWEGPVEVTGSHTGIGYLERTGYE